MLACMGFRILRLCVEGFRFRVLEVTLNEKHSYGCLLRLE